MRGRGFNFTERVRKILDLARRAAMDRNHDYVGPEHILLAIIEEGQGVAAVALENFGVNVDDLRRTVDDMAEPSAGVSTGGTELQYTSRAKKVLELAMDCAHGLDHDYVGSEHVLMGLLREQTGIAARALREAGIEQDNLRAEIERLLDAAEPQERSASIYGTDMQVPKVVAVSLEISFSNWSILREKFQTVDAAIEFLVAEKARPRRSGS